MVSSSAYENSGVYISVSTMLFNELPDNFIGGQTDFRTCFIEESVRLGNDADLSGHVVSLIPASLLSAPCFLDNLTSLWRYEFGKPSHLDNSGRRLLGAHLWIPVRSAVLNLMCAFHRLSQVEMTSFLQRVANVDKHRDTLLEMTPILEAPRHIPAAFEVQGYGPGNSTIDWVIGPIAQRLVLIDVKNRMCDLYASMDQSNVANPPPHDPAILLRSIESKFNPAKPDNCLQGAWITTLIKQDAARLNASFMDMDADKVHFIILGDEERDVSILTRREEDRNFLLNMLNRTASDRFTYQATASIT